MVCLFLSMLVCSGFASAASPSGASGVRLHWHPAATLSAASPAARNRAGFTYDASDRYMLLYGGYQAGYGMFSDTWAYDNGFWNQVPTSSNPPSQVGDSLVYFPPLKKVVEFGGISGFASVYYNSTWTYHAGNWTNLSIGHATSPRGYYEMAYDPYLRSILLFGGDSGTATLDDTWEFNAAGWRQLFPATTPNGTETGAMVWDPATNQMLLFGGYNVTSGVFSTGTWAYSGGNWFLLKNSNTPIREWFQAANTQNGTPIFFGGESASTSTCASGGLYYECNQTFEFFSGAWQHVHALHAPSIRRGGAFAYYPFTKSDIYFGGTTSDPSLTFYQDTWSIR